MITYAKYPQYKKTNLEWLEDIPSEWEYGGLTKYLDSIVDYRGKTPEKVEEGVFLVTAKNIKNGKIVYSLSQEFVKPEEYEEIMRRGLPEIGDVLFTTEAPLGEVANVDRIDIALAQRIIKFRGVANVLNNYYLKYWIQSHGFQSNLKTFATGSTAAGIKASKLSKLQVLLPSYSEQEQIVLFLDNKVHELNDLITQKELMINLLEEKRQSIITEAVTKGLNSNVRMKDSGVEWIGEIPEHWCLSKMKYLGEAITGLTYSPVNITEETGTIVLRSTNIQKGAISLHDNVYVDMDIPDKLLTKKNDILICSRNGSRNLIGKNALIQEGQERHSFGAFTTVFRSKYNYFIYYVLSSGFFAAQLGTYLTTTINQLTIGNLNNMEIVMPPIEEQREIVKYLSEKTMEITKLIADIEKQTKLLTEYRQTLIYEVVTGKIDVRDFKLEE